MKKSQLLSELERLKGDPEIAIKTTHETLRRYCEECESVTKFSARGFVIDRINEFPSPEIIIIEK